PRPVAGSGRVGPARRPRAARPAEFDAGAGSRRVRPRAEGERQGGAGALAGGLLRTRGRGRRGGRAGGRDQRRRGGPAGCYAPRPPPDLTASVLTLVVLTGEQIIGRALTPVGRVVEELL